MKTKARRRATRSKGKAACGKRDGTGRIKLRSKVRAGSQVVFRERKKTASRLACRKSKATSGSTADLSKFLKV